MATITTSGAHKPLDLNHPKYVEYVSSMSAEPDAFSYLAWHGGLVEFIGSDLTYTGDPPDAELSGGTITGFQLEVGGAGTEGPDLTITGLTDVDAAAIDKDDIDSIWSELLKGNDSFDLTGLDASQVGVGLNIAFGDHRFYRPESGPELGRGANDRFLVGDNRFEVGGDACLVSGSAGQLMRYAGGDDRMTAGEAAEVGGGELRLAGDAIGLSNNARLVGGDDRISLINMAGVASAAGDAWGVIGGVQVLGGDDRITVELATALAGDFPGISGDIVHWAGDSAYGDSRLDGGDDLIRFTGAVGGEAAGDAFAGQGDNIDVYGGADTLLGCDGADVLAGDVARRAYPLITVVGGDDLILGGDGDDVLFGEAGWDGSASLGDSSHLTGGDDTIDGGRGDDFAAGQTGDDLLTGDTGKDQLFGGDGNDSVSGDAGADVLDGGSGDDSLFGGDGRDRLRGRAGSDQLDGGEGPDRFIYGAVSDSGIAAPDQDRILGFVHLLDVVDLADIDAKLNGSGSGGNNAFTFIGQADFTESGQIRVTDSGGDALVEMNVYGHAVAEMAILLVGVDFATISEDDFVL